MPAGRRTTVSYLAARRLANSIRWRMSRVREAVARRLAPELLSTQLQVANASIDAEVVAYFAEEKDRVYQLDQWIPVFERLAERRGVLLVLRSVPVIQDLAGRTTLPMVCLGPLTDLMDLYDRGDYKVAIYVNNGMRNFQSLANPRMLHIHVNHGESDKISSFSNQVKGYDRVFVAGEAAAQRYRDALIEFDGEKLVQVGRPQLDLTLDPVLPPSPRHTVLYAPTWEGESESNNWTSVDRYGKRIAEQLLALDNVRVVYKPHPRVPTSGRREVAQGHRAIVDLIASANARDPQAGHTVDASGNVIALLGQADALVGDVSSVTLDYLYLRPDGLIFLTDRRDNRPLLEQDSPLAKGADVVDSSTVGSLGQLVASRLATDSRREDRLRMHDHYFGRIGPGESTQRFLDAVDEAIGARDRLLEGRRRITTGDVDLHG